MSRHYYRILDTINQTWITPKNPSLAHTNKLRNLCFDSDFEVLETKEV